MENEKLGEIILRLHNQGMSYAEIAATVGCSKGTVSYHCSPTARANCKKRVHDRRSKIVKRIQGTKHYKPCADCGKRYPYWVMQFDHLGDKEFTISNCRKHQVNMERLEQEIAKCDIVCANCHAERTHKRSLGL